MGIILATAFGGAVVLGAGAAATVHYTPVGDFLTCLNDETHGVSYESEGEPATFPYKFRSSLAIFNFSSNPSALEGRERGELSDEIAERCAVMTKLEPAPEN